jgi:hypothetical protein
MMGNKYKRDGVKKQLDKSAANAKAIRRPIASYSAIAWWQIKCYAHRNYNPNSLGASPLGLF